jgi:hypothetical protein
MMKHDGWIRRVRVPVSIDPAHSGRLVLAIVVLLLCGSLSFQPACSSGGAAGAVGRGGAAGTSTGGGAGAAGRGGGAGTSTGGVAGVGGNGGSGGVGFPCVGTQGSVPDAGIEICHPGETYCRLTNLGGASGTLADCVPFITTTSCPTIENSCSCTDDSPACRCSAFVSSQIIVSCDQI